MIGDQRESIAKEVYTEGFSIVGHSQQPSRQEGDDGGMFNSTVAIPFRIERDKTRLVEDWNNQIKLCHPPSIAMRKCEKCVMLSGLQSGSTLTPRATLLKVAVSGMINRFFNSDRCRPFQSNNSPVFQADWAVDFEMGSDVLCVGTCHFPHSARHPCGVKIMRT